MIEFTQGDIFQSGCEAVVNPVNCVGVMGGGLAKRFKKVYPEMFEPYVLRCSLGMQPGDVYAWPTGSLFGPKHVLNMATKSHWRNPSDAAYIKRGLKQLSRWIYRTKTTSVALPAIGCGLGGLPWGLVKARIIYQFEALGPDVRIVVYEPHV